MVSQLTLLEWNLNRSSVRRFRRQMAALAERPGGWPVILALVEVGTRAGPRAAELLADAFVADHATPVYPHVVYSPSLLDEDDTEHEEATSSGVLFASRYPFTLMERDELGVPVPHRALSAVFETPFGPLEGHVVHVLPGSTYGWTKVEFFEAIHDRLSQPVDRPRFLCGDFNSPKREHPDGTVEVFGQSRGQRWRDAERSVIEGLAEDGLPDAYRTLHGYENDQPDDWSHQLVRGGEVRWRRRFDHVFASPQLNTVGARYLHELDDHSDHTPLAVTFEPSVSTNPDNAPPG